MAMRRVNAGPRTARVMFPFERWQETQIGIAVGEYVERVDGLARGAPGMGRVAEFFFGERRSYQN